jgi:uncharacterized protein
VGLPSFGIRLNALSHNMVPVKLHGLFFNRDRGEAWLVLADQAGRIGLTIFVGSWDVRLITLGLRKNTPRPMTYHFFANVLEAIGAELVEVCVTDLVNNTFRAEARIRAGTTEHRVDARPSDAIALAMCLGRPVYVAEELMAGIGKPLGADGRPPGLPEGFVSMPPSLWSTKPP